MIKKILIFFIIFTSGLSAQIYNIKGTTNPYFRIGMKNPPIKHSISKERYYYLPDSTNSLTDTMWLQSTPAMVYPQWFGANNSTSIQAAVNSISKGTVNLGSSIYNSTATITLKDSVNIVGDNFTIWTADSIINIFTAVNKKDILISGGKLIGGKRKRYAPNEGSQRKKGNGFLLDNTQFVVIDNMRVYDFQNGVMDDNSENLTVKNSYFHNRQDSAFTCLQLRGTAYSYIYNTMMIDSSKWGTNGSTINAIYWFPGEQPDINNTIEKNHFYGFGYENSSALFPYAGGYETMVLVGGSWNIINNTFEKGMRAIDIATYPYESVKVWNTAIVDNKFKDVMQWCIKLEKNGIGIPSNFQQRYNLISLNKADSCRGFINLFDSTSYVTVTENTARKTFGGWNPTAGTRDATVLITDANHHIIFSENIIDSSAFGGVAAFNVSDCIFSENIITNSGLNNKLDWGAGLRIYSENDGLRKNKRNKIINNTVINSLEHGIYVNESAATILEGNHSCFNGRYTAGFYAGIVLGESDYPIAVANIAAGQDYGMIVNNLSNQYLQFNTFYGNTETGGNDYYTTSGVAAYGKYNAGTDSVKGGIAKFTGLDATGTYALKHGGTLAADAGAIRLKSTDAVTWRNAADNTDFTGISMNVYTGDGTLDIGANSGWSKIRFLPGSSSWADLLSNGDYEISGDFHLVGGTKTIKINNSKTLSRDSLALAGVAPKVRMNGKEILSETNLSIGTTTINQSALKLNNVQVLTTQQAAIGDATGSPDLTYSQNEVDMLNSLLTRVNLLLARQRTHGLISP